MKVKRIETVLRRLIPTLIRINGSLAADTKQAYEAITLSGNHPKPTWQEIEAEYIKMRKEEHQYNAKKIRNKLLNQSVTVYIHHRPYQFDTDQISLLNLIGTMLIAQNDPNFTRVTWTLDNNQTIQLAKQDLFQVAAAIFTSKNKLYEQERRTCALLLKLPGEQIDQIQINTDTLIPEPCSKEATLNSASLPQIPRSTTRSRVNNAFLKH